MHTAGATLAGPLGLTPIFSCSSTICYSSDPAGQLKGTDKLFRDLQATISSFASVAGFSPIAADGKLGAGTVAAAQKVADWGLRQGTQYAPYAQNIKLLAADKASLARNAQQIYDALARLSPLAKGSVVAPTPVAVSSIPVAPASLPAAMPSAALPATTMVKPKWPYYVAGALLLGGALYAFWAFTSPD